LTLQEISLVYSVERSFDNTGILSGLDLLLQPASFWAAGDVHERGQPVERGEQLVDHRSGLDVPWPSNDAGRAVAAFLGFAF
jgi:hypothetical protein